MRIHALLLAVTLAAAATACSSEDPAPATDPAVVESHPGTLVMTSPARAAFLEDDGSAAIEVSGTGATSALTINGERADVAADGTFHAKVKPQRGLNLVVALDGESRLETPFLFGHFLPAGTPVAHAIALDVGAFGISAPAPAASLESVTNLALAKRDLIGAFKGQSFGGTVTGATWTFAVTGGSNGEATVTLAPVAKGLGVNAAVKDVIVDGRLSIHALGLTYARDVRVTAGSTVVTGDVAIALDDATHALTAAMPAAEAKIADFRFDTDNAGFPCCVDTILTGFIKPKIEAAIGDGLREQIPSAVKVTLDGLGLPKQLGFAAAGVAVNVPIATRFDGASFDMNGGTITASALFGGAFAAGTPGAKAPGWLALGRPYSEAATRAPVLGVSFSIDAINQLMFAAWGNGSLSYTAPAPLSAQLAPSLPPVVAITDAGALRLGIGEILVQRVGADHPIAGVTLLQDVVANGDGDALVLTPKGEPTISVTWLTDDSVGSGSNLIAAAAKDQLGKLLKPFRVPVPKFALDKLGGGFAGQSLAIQAPTVVVDKATGRIGAAGKLALTK
jgi:hypothetical protein